VESLLVAQQVRCCSTTHLTRRAFRGRAGLADQLKMSLGSGTRGSDEAPRWRPLRVGSLDTIERPVQTGDVATAAEVTACQPLRRQAVDWKLHLLNVIQHGDGKARLRRSP
jgi:hypothetical protein